MVVKEDLDVLDEVMVATLLSKAECIVEPIMGNSYYLYKRGDNTSFVSIVEPEFWDTQRFKIKFIGSLVYTSEGKFEIDAV